MAERYVKWEPIHGLPRILDPTSVVTGVGKNGHLVFTLVEPIAAGRVFSIVFDRPLAFRLLNESYRLKMLESLQSELPWPTFTVEDSEWAEWFHDQTLGIYRDWPVQHYLFIGEDVVEVLSRVAPKFDETKVDA
jgi:hypothetical protein